MQKKEIKRRKYSKEDEDAASKTQTTPMDWAERTLRADGVYANCLGSGQRAAICVKCGAALKNVGNA